jgi:adenylate cyclase
MRHFTKVITSPKATPLKYEFAGYELDQPGQVLQEKELAFFFLDIRDFTPFIASRPVLEVMQLLQQAFRIFRQAIHSSGGTIIETAGDGLYAVFGLEQPLSQAATSAVEAGMAILQQLDEANTSFFEPLYQHTFQVGIGVHVGRGVVGKFELGVNNQLTVMGYPVNLAARLQQATKQLNNNFVVSQEAYRLLTQPPKSATKSLSLKGIPGQVAVHLLGKPYVAERCHPYCWQLAS